MAILTPDVQYVIGVDTHRDTHTVAVLAAGTGALLGRTTCPADAAGYAQICQYAQRKAPGATVWAVEGTGSYGAGLTSELRARGQRVCEVDRPKRIGRRRGKSDDIDAERAARQLLAEPFPAAPRARGDRHAMRLRLATREQVMADRTRAVNALKAAVLTAPDSLRTTLKGRSTTELVVRCLRLRTAASHDLETRHTIECLRAMAKRYRTFTTEIAEHDTALTELVEQACPQILDLFGVGPITAAELLTGWSYPGRIHSPGAFAMLSGVAPIPASSGTTQRVRLNRGGDRSLNKALHTIAITRARGHAQTQDYIARRIAEGKSRREAIRCLKNYLARKMFKYLEHHAQPPH